MAKKKKDEPLFTNAQLRKLRPWLFTVVPFLGIGVVLYLAFRDGNKVLILNSFTNEVSNYIALFTLLPLVATIVGLFWKIILKPSLYALGVSIALFLGSYLYGNAYEGLNVRLSGKDATKVRPCTITAKSVNTREWDTVVDEDEESETGNYRKRGRQTEHHSETKYLLRVTFDDDNSTYNFYEDDAPAFFNDVEEGESYEAQVVEGKLGIDYIAGFE